MNRREHENWQAAFGVLVLIGLGLLVAGLYEACVVWVRVPLILPIAATTGCLWSGYLVLERRAVRNRELREEEQKRAREVEQRRDRRTATQVLDTRIRDLDTRIGDAERDVIISALHAHFAAGRLDQGELEERIAQALAAKTISDLTVAVRELPSEVTGR